MTQAEKNAWITKCYFHSRSQIFEVYVSKLFWMTQFKLYENKTSLKGQKLRKGCATYNI